MGNIIGPTTDKLMVTWMGNAIKLKFSQEYHSYMQDGVWHLLSSYYVLNSENGMIKTFLWSLLHYINNPLTEVLLSCKELYRSLEDDRVWIPLHSDITLKIIRVRTVS
jgi:hypothetical protein